MRLYFHYALKHHTGQMVKLHWLNTVQWKDDCERRTTVYNRIWPVRYEGWKTEYQPNQPNNQKNNHIENFEQRKSTSLGPFSHSRVRNASLYKDTDTL